MLKKAVITTCLIFAFCFTEAFARQDGSQNLSQPIPKTKYETFLAPPDKIFLTQSYHIAGVVKGSGYEVSVMVSWELGEKQKVYAVKMFSQYVDFEQLEPLQKRLDQFIQTIKSFDELGLSLASYRLSQSVSVSYYSWVDEEGKKHHNLYLNLGGYTQQSSTSIEALEKLRDYVAQARAKIISLQTK